MAINLKMSPAPPFFELECTGIQNAFLALKRLLRKEDEGEGFSCYFRLVGEERPMDICVFQLLIRYTLPVMDLFYLEYLNWLIRQKKILHLLIVSTEDDYFPGQQVDVWEKHKENISGIFAGNLDHVTIMDAKKAIKATNTTDLFCKDFYDLLEYVSNDFLEKEIREPFALGVTHFSEYNMHHPNKLRLEATYRHLTGGYVVWRYLLSKGIIPKERVVVGHLCLGSRS